MAHLARDELFYIFLYKIYNISMKKIIYLLLFLITITLFSCSSNKLPLPEIEEGIRGDLKIDKNINEDTIDNYLNRDDSVYRDMRMLVDEADYENIGGSSFLTGFVKGFEVVPYPYICNVEDLPSEVGTTYSGNTLFSLENGEYKENYKESLDIIESLFPRDKYIFLMCGGGGYAGKMKDLLVSLDYDEDKIYNVGGYWYYNGKNNVEVEYEKNNETYYNFALVNYHYIDFSTLTCLDCKKEKVDVEKEIDNSNFIKINGINELQELENNHSTFPLFVYLSGCSSCAEFFPVIEEFVKENDIDCYALDLHSIWGLKSSVTDRIDRAPSLFIYEDGKVIGYLNPQSDEDYNYYKSVDNLNNWISKRIDIESLKCKECVVE